MKKKTMKIRSEIILECNFHNIIPNSSQNHLLEKLDKLVHLSFELSSVPNKRPLDKFGKLENHIECFSIGDVVVKYRGFEHLVKICGSSSKTCICIQCGYHSSPANEYCIHCGKELINVKSIHRKDY